VRRVYSLIRGLGWCLGPMDQRPLVVAELAGADTPGRSGVGKLAVTLREGRGNSGEAHLSVDGRRGDMFWSGDDEGRQR
jgi:hypothetical protein